jgi:hypothetical protein
MIIEREGNKNQSWSEWYVNSYGWKTVDVSWLTGTINDMAERIGTLSGYPEIFYEDDRFLLYVFLLNPRFLSQQLLDEVKRLSSLLSEDFEKYDAELEEFESRSDLHKWISDFYQVHPCSHVVFVLSKTEGNTIFCENFPTMIRVVSEIKKAYMFPS